MKKREPGAAKRPEPGQFALSDILEAGAVLVARNFLVFARITASLLVPINLILIALTLVFGVFLSGKTNSVVVWVVVFAFSVADLFALILAGGACLRAAAEIYRGEKPSARAALVFVRAHLASLSWLAAILLVTIAPGLVLFAVAPSLGRFAPLALLALVLSLWLMGIWSVTPPVLLVEEKGVRKALARSRVLVRGHFWRALGTVILGSILALFAGFLARVLVSVLSTGGGNARVAVVTITGSMLGALLTIPLLGAYLTLLYYDLLVREEVRLEQAE